MNELKETIDNICSDLRDINAILAARSRELDRREAFDNELDMMIEELRNSVK